MSVPNDTKFLQLLQAIPTYLDPLTNEPKVAKLLCQGLVVYDKATIEGELIIAGTIKNDLNLTGSLLLDDGVISKPSLAFRGNTELGLYRSGLEEIAFVSNGTSKLRIGDSSIISSVPISTSELTTSGGNLSVNPAGGNVDFNGKNLINVGNIVVNTDVYDILSTQTSTSDNTPTTIFTIPTLALHNYYMRVVISAYNVDAAETQVIETAFKVYNPDNISGTISPPMYTSSATDTSLIGTSVSASIQYGVGPVMDIIISAVGLPASVVIWYCTAHVFRHPIVLTK